MSTAVTRITTIPDATKYRRDIDGLRAVAVLAVVIFHAFPSLLRGGFIGVDIFFVISGFLITNILLAELETDEFSIGKFYIRRIRRIFPSLVTVLIAVYALGWYSLFKDEYKQLGKHILAGSGFVANLAFWNEAGYFDVAAQTKPLLHLWSLGVEEQFYIIWPLVLAVVHRRRANLLGAIVAGAVISFGVNVALISHHPAAAFFSPISRFWELLAGALLAWSSQTQLAVDGPHENWKSVAGLVLCVAAMFGLNSSMDFPGWWALLPVVGTALLISGRNTAFNTQVLGCPPLVWIGKISYPLYLWHWPLLSFATILAGDTPEPHVRIGAIALSVVLAWLTCATIENPVRFGKPHWSKVVVPCVLLAAIAYVGGMTYVRDGLVFRKGYSSTADVNTATLGAGHEFTRPECGVPKTSQHLFDFCAEDRREKPRAVVWGDSKADSLYWGLVRASNADQRWTLVARASCAPLTGVAQFNPAVKDDPEVCESADRLALEAILGNRDLKLVVLGIAARDLIDPRFVDSAAKTADPDGAFNGLGRSITALQRAGKRVVLVIDNPTLPDPRGCMDRRLSGFAAVRALLSLHKTGVESDHCTIAYNAHLAATAKYRAIVSKLQTAYSDLLVFDPTPILCDVSKGICPIARNGKYLYSYGDHISDTANGLIAAQLLAQLNNSESHALQK